jgi:hypothetical protein
MKKRYRRGSSPSRRPPSPFRAFLSPVFKPNCPGATRQDSPRHTYEHFVLAKSLIVAVLSKKTWDFPPIPQYLSLKYTYHYLQLSRVADKHQHNDRRLVKLKDKLKFFEPVFD